MLALELTCAVIVATYLAVRARRDEAPRAFLARLAVAALGGWCAEESVMHAYGFYAYSPEWSVILDRMPLMVAIIWPVVISSAWDLARRLVGERGPWPVLLGGAIVTFDASLIEPTAVRAGLWRWTEPGLFTVPPIGILGWGFFAAIVMFGWQRRWRPLALLAASVVGTHVLLLATWWGALRWVNGVVPEVPVIALLWAVSLPLAVWAWRARLSARVPVVEMLLRIPGAIFFFVLLALAKADLPLVAWVAGFAPPYLALTAWRELGRARAAAGAITLLAVPAVLAVLGLAACGPSSSGAPGGGAGMDAGVGADAGEVATGTCTPGLKVLDGLARNARDLGGIPVAGGVTRCGRVFRGAYLTSLSAEGCAALAELGVRTVVDLREASEGGGRPIPCDDAPRVVSAPLPIPYALSPENYLADLDTDASIRAAFDVLGDRASYPVFVNCTYGRDRTGVVVALVLGALGASRDDILTDYEQTRANGLNTAPESLITVLDELERRGGPVAHLESIGVSTAALDLLRAQLVR